MLKFSVATVLLFIAASPVFSQGSAITKDANGLVTISSRGNDVRLVVHDLFTQHGKNYILEPGVKFQTLYLSLAGVEFDEALFQVCRLAELKFDVQNGIFYISKVVKPVEKKPEPKTESKPITPKEAPVEKPAPPKQELKGPLPNTVLTKRVTTKFEKVDIRELMAEFSKQTGVKLEVDAKVPNYKLDAYLNNTSLKYALDIISNAAGLRYRFSDRQSIILVPLVSMALDSNPAKGNSSSTGH